MCLLCEAHLWAGWEQPTQDQLVLNVELIKKYHPWEFAQAQMTEHERKFSDAKAKREP